MNKKTFSLIALPLVVISAFTSCDNKKPIDYTVNEEEFNDAVSFKDVTHMQVVAKKISTDVVFNYRLSPNMFYMLGEGHVDEATYYHEEYIKKTDSEGYEGTERSSADDSFHPMTPKDAENAYSTPQDMSFLDVLKEVFGDNPYQSFKFENNLYFATQTIESETCILSFRFENKKLVEYNAPEFNDLNVDLLDSDCQFTYNHEDVIWPK